MEWIIVCLASFGVAILTFFAGFGIGTLLSPVFMLFFPIDVAIALTGIVHFCNNLFKLWLVGRHADKKTILRFGLPAIPAAMFGSYLLLHLSELQHVLFKYQIGSMQYEIVSLKLVIGILLLIFSLVEILPVLNSTHFSKKHLAVGGVLSGFLGGLSGHQGALRSAFLLKIGLSKEAYIATGVVIACIVDVSRLSVYSSRLYAISWEQEGAYILLATVSALVGSLLGKRLIQKVTIVMLQRIVVVMLLLFSLSLILGIL
mgnify:CR=1 FL=1